jgi:hypothetical protein
LADTLLDEVQAEIEALHEFFVGWFGGRLPKDRFEPDFLARFDPDFILVPPAGTTLGLGILAESVRSSHASNPDFRISIRNVHVRRVLDGHVLATYEEWQRNALASTPPDNGRVASVLFRNERPFVWLHIHETWLPERVAQAGPYDF